jgi:hypothetical protein
MEVLKSKTETQLKATNNLLFELKNIQSVIEEHMKMTASLQNPLVRYSLSISSILYIQIAHNKIKHSKNDEEKTIQSLSLALSHFFSSHV